jgi:D-glycero-D-manno-heptose 1,7-bisphosphate phosphatase
LRDLQAAKSAGCKPVLVLTGKGKKTFDDGFPEDLGQPCVYQNLAAFADAQLRTDAT